MSVTTLLLFMHGVRLVIANSERIDMLDVKRIEDAPFSVLVLCNNNKMFCTGTLMHESWVLTSAHCLYDEHGLFTEDDGSVTVIAGADRLAYSLEDVAANRTQVRQSERIVVHGEYSFAESFVNDLALVKLHRPVILGPRVAVAKCSRKSEQLRERYTSDLDSSGQPPPSHTDSKRFLCELYGFGKMQRYVNHKNDYSIKMQELEVAKHCHCLEKLRSVRQPYSVLRKKNTFICDEFSSWAGLCMGDNGAQLVCNGVLRGIGTTIAHYDVTNRCSPTPGGLRHECGDMHALSVFTDLCPHGSWLAEHVPGLEMTVEQRPCVWTKRNIFQYEDDLL